MNILIQAITVVCFIMTSHQSDAGMWDPNKDNVVGQCPKIQLSNGSTCKATGPQTMCSFTCNSGYEISGPNVIYCDDNKWYDYYQINQVGKVAGSLYKFDTKCRKDFGLARDFTTTSAKCSVQTCHKSFTGITKLGCQQKGCCWNTISRTCHENHCSDSFPGIPKEACELSQCTYDDKTGNCYKALPPPVVASPPPTQCSKKNCIKAYGGITKSGCTDLDCCWNTVTKTCHENQCSGTYRGVPKSMCEKKGCNYDDSIHECYQKSSSINSRSFIMQPRFSISFQDFKPVECPILENNDANLRIDCGNGRFQGSVCKIECVGENILRGKSLITCLPTAKWSVSMEDIKSFYCQEKKIRRQVCSNQLCAVSFPGMSQKSCENEGCCWNENKKSCTSMQCPDTFKGIPQSKCLEKGCAYNPQNFQCYVATRCPLLHESSGLKKHCTKENKGNSFCWLSCKFDLILSGPSYMRCGSNNGKWKGIGNQAGNEWTEMSDGSQPYCHPKNCPSLPAPNQGVKMSCTSGNNISSICRYSCASSTYQLHGPKETSCQRNGVWSDVEYPECKRACALTANLNNGVVSIDEDQQLIKLSGPLVKARRDGECSRQGTMEVNFAQMKNLKLDLSYTGEASGFHLTVKNEQQELVVMAFNKNLYFSFDDKSNKMLTIFGGERKVSLEFDRIDGALVYVVEKSGEIPEVGVTNLPVLMTSKKLFVEIHKNFFFPGKGICDICASFVPL